ncbi:FCD domain-containing protein [Streptomyces sp. NPDC002896]|uniref:FCD domain-containing protein n=1 Tax=Streptomyces sp. NPDC002896 TaxID=3154438 RepID=UPI00332EADCD
MGLGVQLEPVPGASGANRLLMAVASATGADLAEMDRCLRCGAEVTTSEESERWNTVLHHSFAVATHNAVLVSVSSLLVAARRRPVWRRLKRRTFNPERHRCYCDEHERIISAVRERDPKAHQLD